MTGDVMDHVIPIAAGVTTVAGVMIAGITVTAAGVIIAITAALMQVRSLAGLLPVLSLAAHWPRLATLRRSAVMSAATAT
ncbi:hypothetical protein D3C73_810140 [compost metagenome]